MVECSKKISVGGVKLSRELAQIDLKWPAEKSALVSLLQPLAQKKINLVYLSISACQPPSMTSFCVAHSDLNVVKELIDSDPSLLKSTIIKAPVGALTVFPHRSSLTLLGRLLTALTTADCPVYGVASSISTLTFKTDYHCIDQALKALESILDLPPHHTPYRQEFLVKQV